MKIIFLGTSKFGSIILEKMANSGYSPALVITAPDKPSGRKQIVTPPPVKITAGHYEFKINQPERVRHIETEIRNAKPDLIVTAAYGQILPQEILDIPQFGCLNVHPSLLPKYRGASPVQHAILSGGKETGVTIILMDAIMDHGPIVAQKKTVIGSNENFPELHDRLARLGGELLVDIIPDWVNGGIKAQRQNETEATYTTIIKKESGLIDWAKPAEEIERQVRAFNPWPGTYTFWEKKIFKVKGKKSLAETRRIYVKILAAEVTKGKTVQKKNGEVLPTKVKELAVQTGRGQLNILKLQIEGKKPADPRDFLAGHADFIGVILKK
ncbi:MAG: methionyl-tRNA formyltransferase [Candidatus Nealsonbacteria bacterium]|nr:methionyl-tRNA formyltransferase [Candidatus Nealsonbacteria bacterium]